MGFTIAPAELVAMLDDEKLRLIDARRPEDFALEHIPNARSLPISRLLENERPDAIARLAEGVGIDREKLVVIYDDHWGTYAARTAWALERVGLLPLLLATSFSGWRSSGLPTSKESSDPRRSRYKPTENRAIVADAGYIKSALHDGNRIVLVDTRDRLAHLEGHIPRAKTMPWQLFRMGDAILASAEEVRRILVGHGIGRDSEVVTYCDVGITAALAFYAFRAAGVNRVRLYPGSFMEWEDLGLPVEKVEQAYYRDLT